MCSWWVFLHCTMQLSKVIGITKKRVKIFLEGSTQFWIRVYYFDRTMFIIKTIIGHSNINASLNFHLITKRSWFLAKEAPNFPVNFHLSLSFLLSKLNASILWNNNWHWLSKFVCTLSSGLGLLHKADIQKLSCLLNFKCQTHTKKNRKLNSINQIILTSSNINQFELKRQDFIFVYNLEIKVMSFQKRLHPCYLRKTGIS